MMKAKIITVLMALIAISAFSGCQQTEQLSAEMPISSFSESKTERTETKADYAEPEETAALESTSETKTEKPTIEEKMVETESTTVSDTQNIAESTPPKQEVQSPSSEVEQPKETDETDSADDLPPVTSSEPEQTPPAPSEPEETTKPQEPAFDIEHWISYAKSYAESVGLVLNCEAVYCWDNPIGAGAHSKYLERDITACLNRYAKDDEITDVWIWAEKTGENTYDLYIGYA